MNIRQLKHRVYLYIFLLHLTHIYGSLFYPTQTHQHTKMQANEHIIGWNVCYYILIGCNSYYILNHK